MSVLRFWLLSSVLCLLTSPFGTLSQSCTFQDNTDYDNGYLVMLYDLPSAAGCCEACSTFEECTYFSFIKDPNAGDPWAFACFIKNSNSSPKADNATTAGSINRTPPPPYQCASMQDNTDYNNGWLSLIEQVPSAAMCCEICANYPGCKYWSWIKDTGAGAWYQRCFMKASNSGQVVNNGTTAGSSTAVAPPPPRTGKRGLGWFNSNACSDLKLMKGVSWWYNWSPTPNAYLVTCSAQLGMEFVPMQWGGGGIDDLNQTVWAASGHLLGFNEPNFYSQSNVAPQAAAQLWPQMEAVAKQHGLKLGSPSASSCGPDPATDCYAASSSPIQWFDDFFGNCTGCQVDFLTTHIYTCDLTELKNYINSLKKYNLPIWLSEFACPASGQPDQVELDYMKQVLLYLDGEAQIAQYAWFGTRLDPTDGWLGPQVDLLMDNSSALTELGILYTTPSTLFEN